MSPFEFSSFPANNPFINTTFWGRQNELKTIYRYLLSDPPQCCAVIGETSFGKTTLLRHLSDPQDLTVLDESLLEVRDLFTFVYNDCIAYIDLIERGEGDYASARFWWDLYSALWTKLQRNTLPPLSEPKLNAEQEYVDVAFEIKCELEDFIRIQPRRVVFVLDNFECVARLPLHDSEWLRSMAQRSCTYVVASRHLLYLLYQYNPGAWENPSPLWNLFADPIYLGLVAENEVRDYLRQASDQARELGSAWKQSDSDFIRKIAGRHPMLIRIASVNLFRQRLQNHQIAEVEKNEFDVEFLEYSIQEAASPICAQLWRGLADSEFWDTPNFVGHLKAEETQALSPYQEGLIEVAKGSTPLDKKVLFILEQRGLIERVNGRWCVFSEVMRQFALKQDQAVASQFNQHPAIDPIGTLPASAMDGERREDPNFTNLEQEVFDYLVAHLGEVCSREGIKRAVWGEEGNLSNSAVQKIIERIRGKIEPDTENPRYLIAVRGQGYILRENPLKR
jgi:Transcriptional regulatory protein, C terminal